MKKRTRRPLVRVLREDHVLVRRALDLLARHAQRVGAGGDHEPRLARDLLRFLRDFADRRHHRDEERRLFPWLAARGFTAELGPLAVLRHEHELARDLRVVLAFSADALLARPSDRAERERFRQLALRYVELQLAHLLREEEVLFPLVERLGRGDGPTTSRAPAAAERSWLARERARAADWPAPELTTWGYGTVAAFERLCRTALDANGKPERRRVRTTRLRSSKRAGLRAGKQARSTRRRGRPWIVAAERRTLPASHARPKTAS